MTANVVFMHPAPRVTSEPADVASFIVNQGWWGSSQDAEGQEDKIVLLDEEDEVTWWLNREQALAIASRLTILAAQMPDKPRKLRRLSIVDDQLREMDQ